MAECVYKLASKRMIITSTKQLSLWQKLTKSLVKHFGLLTCVFTELAILVFDNPVRQYLSLLVHTSTLYNLGQAAILIIGDWHRRRVI